jgi:hypothetical protein
MAATLCVHCGDEATFRPSRDDFYRTAKGPACRECYDEIVKGQIPPNGDRPGSRTHNWKPFEPRV